VWLATPGLGAALAGEKFPGQRDRVTWQAGDYTTLLGDRAGASLRSVSQNRARTPCAISSGLRSIMASP